LSSVIGTPCVPVYVVKHGPATTRAAHHVDAITSARLEIHIVDRLHATETQARGKEPVETHRARDLAASARIEQRQVATHVLLAGRGRIDDELETMRDRNDHVIRH
jgi:hypothetical protein